MATLNKAPAMKIRLRPSTSLFGGPLMPCKAATVSLGGPPPCVGGSPISNSPRNAPAPDDGDDGDDYPFVGPVGRVERTEVTLGTVSRPKPTASFTDTLAFKAGVTREEAAAQVSRLAQRLGCSELEAATAMMKSGVRTRQTPPKVRSSGGSSDGDFINQARRLAADQGLRIDQAMSLLARQRPELHKRYKASCERR